jgi:hypothetical protein
MFPPTSGAQFQIGRHGKANDQPEIKKKINFNQTHSDVKLLITTLK